MPFEVKIMLVYLLAVNIASIIVCAFDKYCAVKDLRRVPEKTLFLLSAIGGSVCMLATMKIIRHKTLHKRFMIGIPIIMVLQIVMTVAVIYLTR